VIPGDGQPMKKLPLLLVVLCTMNYGCSKFLGWGYIDPAGSLKIEAQFDFAAPFSEGLAAVMLRGKWGYIDLRGNFVIPPRFNEAGPFSDGLALVRSKPGRDAPFGYIDKTGTVVIEERFTWAGWFSEGLAEACLESCASKALKDFARWRIGYVDHEGVFVVRPKFSSTRPFSSGLAPAREDRSVFGYIDRTGDFVIAPRFTRAQVFSEGLAATNEGYIDTNGKVVIPLSRYATAHEFSEGLARIDILRPAIPMPGEPSLVQIPPGTSFIDHEGKVVLRRDRCTGDFSEGLATACDADFNTGFIDTRGEFVIPSQWRRAGPFSYGLAPVCFGCE
jgi:hypothetical protein